ncbi:MAG: LPS export ABC transporter periplasmic protein LptC [Candidatus Cloacimonetes bacterium]|nr:LPS export ABC transporter periplasmic protein LptC [Candidatus Cloacimonadota bacterium]
MRMRLNAFLLILLLGSFLLLLFACGAPENQPMGTIDLGLPDEQSDSVRVTSMNGELIEYILEAVHIDRWYDKKLVLADTIKITTFNDDGTVKSVITCDKARMDEVSNILIGRHNVRIKSENGLLKSTFMTWDRSTEEIVAKGQVILIRDGTTLTGYELKTDVDLEKIEMINVSAEGLLDEEDVDL